VAVITRRLVAAIRMEVTLLRVVTIRAAVTQGRAAATPAAVAPILLLAVTIPLRVGAVDTPHLAVGAVVIPARVEAEVAATRRLAAEAEVVGAEVVAPTEAVGAVTAAAVDASFS